MSKIITSYISNVRDLSRDDYSEIQVCLGDFQTLSNNELRLISVLKGLIEYESSNTEMSQILSGREIASEYLDIDNSTDQFYIEAFEKMGTNEIIIIGYDTYNVIIPEKLAIQVIIDWCKENATNPEIPALCEKMKEKYNVAM